jgi:2C-methyl-D-erythritol 2,4-cyclodiphosphate synthase
MGGSEHICFWLKILLLEGRHVSAPLLGHHQVTKNIFKGNYVGGRVTVRVILQRDLVVTFVAKISRVIAKMLNVHNEQALFSVRYELNLCIRTLYKLLDELEGP